MQFKCIKLAAAAACCLCAAAVTSAAPTQPDMSAPSAPSLHGLPDYPVTTQQRARAEAAARAGVPLAELSAGAPARYTVRRGDTLWALAAMYLRRPWNWPQLWGMNLTRIRDPHWIFPGQVLVLHEAGGRAWLSAEGRGALPTVRLEPGVRVEPLPPPGIPTLDPQVVASFLARPLIIEPEQLARAPRIVALASQRSMLAPGDRAFVRGPLGHATHFDVYRPARPLREPASGRIIAWQADYLGRVDLVHGPKGPDAVATVDVRHVVRDMGVGDRLIARPPRQFLDFTPHAPAHPIRGTIVATYGDFSIAGRNSVVVIDRGAADGLQRGDVLVIEQPSRRVDDRTMAKPAEIELPAQRDGLLMVFRLFHHVAYGLVLRAPREGVAGDDVRAP